MQTHLLRMLECSHGYHECFPSSGFLRERARCHQVVLPNDYFVNEIAMANVDTLGRIAPVMVRHWFSRKNELFARVSPLLIDDT